MKECENCVLSCEEIGYEGECYYCWCLVSEDFKENKYCYMPNWICKIKLYFMKKKSGKYWNF